MTQGRFHLFDMFGVPVFVNVSFLIPLIFCFTAYRYIPNPGLMFALGFFYALGLFAAILLHETGHLMAARWFGVGTKMIEIHGLGGVAILARSTRSRLQSIVISLAGPAVNLGLYLLATGCFEALMQYRQAAVASGQETYFIAPGPYLALMDFAWLNLFLLVFNLLPAFPLDGGNAARQALSWLMRDTTATKAVAICGMLTGVAIAALSQRFGWTLLLLALIMVLENWQIFKSTR